MKRGLSLKECYAMLGIPEGSNLEEVKRAYRKRAFELHPDLNPNDGASRQFQQLNEAYVILIRLLDMHKEAPRQPRQEDARREPEPSAASAKAGQDSYREQARKNREREEKERRERQEAERRVRERQEQEEKQRREDARRERLREEIERQEAERLARKEKAREERERLAKTRLEAEREREEMLRREAEPKPETHRRTYAKSGQRSSGEASKNGAGSDAYAEQDEPARQAMLNDLLNDPFARRVYEDIYSEIQNRKSAPSEPEKVIPSQPPAREARNIGEALRGWARGQLDQAQELFFPAQSLYPGAKFRLKVRPGLSGEPRTIEVTLPQDFVAGKPVRLKGMGKKVGKWQGDLYLTFQIKS